MDGWMDGFCLQLLTFKHQWICSKNQIAYSWWKEGHGFYHSQLGRHKGEKDLSHPPPLINKEQSL
ncbi:hypothetical protein P3514_30910, partial [Vibrio parahaemolyticus]|nr:hypothetical protein [Vibrio parahaemolyticus]